MNHVSTDIRKVQRTADGTFFISLPKVWAKRVSIAKGTPIYLRERSDGCLVLDPQFTSEVSPEVTIGVSKRLEYDILGYYLLGCDTIRIEDSKITEEVKQRIKKAAGRLVGAEIVDEDAEHVVIQCLLKPSAFPPDRILRREYVLSSSLVSDAFLSVLNNDIGLAETVLQRDEEVDRLYFLIVRLLRTLIVNPRLSEKLNISLIDCLDYRLIASLMETIADHAVEIARLAGKINGPELQPILTESFKIAAEKVRLAYEVAVKAIFVRGEKALHEASEQREVVNRMLKKLENAIGKVKPAPPTWALACLSNARRIVLCVADMADLVTPLHTAHVHGWPSMDYGENR